MAKILWVIHGAEVYGESRAIRSLMHGVRASGWEAEAISLTRGGCYDRLVAEGLPVKCLEMDDFSGLHLVKSRFRKLLHGLRLATHQSKVSRRVREHIRACKADVVHVLDKNMLHGVGSAAYREGIPCFWEMTAVVGTNYPFEINRRIYTSILRRLKITPLANSRYTAESLGNVGHPIDVMYLGVDPEHFDPTRDYGMTREKLGIPSDAVVFAIVARIDETKGQDVFFEALAKATDIQAHLLLVGGGTMEGDFERLQNFVADKTSLFQSSNHLRVHFVGFSPEPQAYFAVADIGVNSRLDAEPFGLTVIEAMMMSRPVLVHALGGPKETVLDGQTGWHVEKGTVEGFAQGIRRAVDDRIRWKEMGEMARQRAVKMFSVEEQTRHYREIVERRIGEMKRKP